MRKFAAALVLFLPLSAYATVGIAEWEIEIGHVDPFTEHGALVFKGETVFVSTIEWWRFYPGKIAGLSKNGYFLFDEKTAKTEKLDSERALEAI